MLKQIAVMALCTLGCNVLNALGTPPDGVVSLPTAASVEERMHRVNDWQLAHPWKETDRNWMRATWYTGVMKK